MRTLPASATRFDSSIRSASATRSGFAIGPAACSAIRACAALAVSFLAAIVLAVGIAFSATSPSAYAQTGSDGEACLSLSAVGTQAETAETAETAEGTWGTCPWKLVGGVLTIRPGTGENTDGGYGANSAAESPWKEYESQITQVNFVAEESDGITSYVVFPEIANSLLLNMDNLESVDFSGADASQCKYMRNFLAHFGSGNKLTEVDLSMMKDAKPSFMKSFFDGCRNLTSVKLKEGSAGFDTSEVEDFTQLFSQCKALTEFDYADAGFDMSSATTLASMFQGCTNLETVDLAGADMRKVTTMQNMFRSCSSLTRVVLPTNEDGGTQGYPATSELTDMQYMFDGCSALTDIYNLCYMDTANVTTMRGLFNDCASLVALTNGVASDGSNFLFQSTASVTDMRAMFAGCFSLASLDLSGFDTNKVASTIGSGSSAATGMADMFEGCDALAQVKVGESFSFFGEDAAEVKALQESLSSGVILVGDPDDLLATYCEPLTYLPENSVNADYPTSWYSCTDKKWYTNTDIAYRIQIADTYRINGSENAADYTPITTVDVGNIWTMLDPVNDVPFTAEVHDAEDEDGVNFTDKMKLIVEKWTNYDDCNDGVSYWVGDPELSSPGKVKVNERYLYGMGLRAKGDYVFLKPESQEWKATFACIYGGTKVQLSSVVYGDEVTDSEGNPLKDASGRTLCRSIFFSPIKDAVAVQPVNISGATVTGVADKTYTGAAQTQSLAVKMSVNGTPVTLKSGTDYTLSYANNVNVGTATVKVSGTGNYTGSVSRTFKINAAPVDPAKQMGEDGTALGRGASSVAAENAILANVSEKDPAGSAFAPLMLRSTKQAKTSLTLKWAKAAGAAKYVVYASKCGKVKMTRVVETAKTSYALKKLGGKKLKKGTYYKAQVVALDAKGNVVAASKVAHVATKGGKLTNLKKVTIKKAVVKKAKKLKVGKTLKLGAKQVKQSKKLKVKSHRGLKYETSNAKVATVSAKGVVKGVAKGTCYVYAYTQTGTYARVKVTVK